MAFVTFGPQVAVLTPNSPGQWLCPAGVTSVSVQCWGAGGGGAVWWGGSGGGGGGGAYAANFAVAVTGGTLYSYTVGQGGAGGLLAASTGTYPGTAGGATTFTGNSGVTVSANGGGGAGVPQGYSAGAGGTAGSAPVAYAGGMGGAGQYGQYADGPGGGGGGGSAGTGSAGKNGAIGGVPANGAVQGGFGGAGGAAVPSGGAGGNGGTYGSAFYADGQPGVFPGGGGGGSCGLGPGHGTYGGNGADGQILLTYVLPPTWTCPAGVYSVLAECWGAGGGGGARSGGGAGAGGGGEYAAQIVATTPGNTYAVTVGAPGAGASTPGSAGLAGGNTLFPGDSVTVTAHGGGGGSGSAATGGTGGTGSSATAHYTGGGGGTGATDGGGGGGGSAAAGSAGNAGGNATSSAGGAGATALTGGGPGGNGGTHTTQPGGLTPLLGPGGGGGGGYSAPGGSGFAGRVTLTWAVLSLECTSEFIASQFGAPQVVNQWAATTPHSPVFGPSLPLNASTVVALDPSSSVGGGTGYASAGNWLFCCTGWHAAQSPVTVACSDDLHSFWRPQRPSDASGGSRTTIWFTPNLIGSPGYVYVAPSGYADGFGVLVVEVAGLGPWDLTTTSAASAPAATALDMYCPAGVVTDEYSAGVPGPVLHPITDSEGFTDVPYSGGVASAIMHPIDSGGFTPLPDSGTVPELTFFLAAACGDSAAAQTSLAPYGWTSLATVVCSNGTDASSDAVLTAACIISAAAQNITATAAGAENLSGMIIAAVIDAPSPVPVVRNAVWPYVIAEAAFGSGMQTPPDEMVWVNIQSPQGGHRMRSWSETTGIQYELDQLQASETEIALDNPDGYLSPSNPGSPYYPWITPGTPIRLRMVPPNGNRWHIIQRNMERWPQSWEKTFRGISNATATDVWSTANRYVATCYRAEVLADNPGWWWPCDDSGVNQATSLVNAAPASSSPLQITVSPNGLTSYGAYDGSTYGLYAYVAIQQFAQQSGWMYGDSLSAAWQQSGTGVSNCGRYLSCNDTFPLLSGGVTIEAWWQPSLSNAGYSIPPAPREAPSPEGYNAQPTATQGAQGTPVGPLVIWEIASDTGPLAMLSLDANSQLTFTTWSGGIPSATVIYSLYPDQYLWDGAWIGVTVTMTQTSWTVYLNGGVLATVSGSAAMGDAWSWFLAGAATGNAGGPPTAGTVTGIPNAAWSHLAIYPQVLPAARVMAHFMAAYAAFGQLPAPSVTCQFTANAAGGPLYMPDGQLYLQIQFFNPTGAGGGPAGDRSVLAVYVTSTAGQYTSAVSQPESVNLYSFTVGAGPGQAWLSATGLAPSYSYWCGNTGGGEQLYATSIQPYMYVTHYGTGPAPPSEGSALGDTVASRIERLLWSGGVTTPQRAIDPADLACVAELDTGGQSAGDNISNIVQSDDGLMFIDTCGNLCYFSRQHLASQSPAWQLGPFTDYGQVPYLGDVTFDTDPQRIYNDIAVTQYDTTAVPAGQAGSATGSGETHGGLVFGPGAQYAAAVQASLAQYGDCQLQFTSYLQDTSQIQDQASWLFAMYGTPRQRVTSLTVDAAAMANVPGAWEYVLAVNPGDVIQVTQSMPGQPAFTGIWRVTQVKRKLNFAAGTASATVLADWCPPWWWGTGDYQEIDDQALAAITDMDGEPME
jgi:hypothetical protein